MDGWMDGWMGPRYLKDSETGFFGEDGLFVVAGVGIVAVIVEPFLQQPHRFFGQVTASSFVLLR